jgi:hypothetical protein
MLRTVELSRFVFKLQKVNAVVDGTNRDDKGFLGRKEHKGYHLKRRFVANLYPTGYVIQNAR